MVDVEIFTQGYRIWGADMIFKWLKNWLSSPKPPKNRFSHIPPAYFHLLPARRAKIVRKNGIAYVVPEKPKYIPVLAGPEHYPKTFIPLRPPRIAVPNPDYLSDDFDESEAIRIDESEAKKYEDALAKKLAEDKEPT